MNCRSFDAIIDDLARGALMDAQTRDQALGHAEECGACAARLDDECSLTAGLRAVASLTAEAAAPPRVEAALLAAFRARHADADAAAPAVAAAEVNAAHAPTPFVGRRREGQWWLPRWAQGAAVAAASALLVFGLYFLMRGQTPQGPGVAGRDEKGTPQQQQQQQQQQAAVHVVPDPVEDVPEELADETDDVVAPKRRLSNRAPQLAAQRLTGGRALNVNNSGRAAAPEAGPAEIATDFIPLMNGGQLAPGDSGHVMRVEVPRTALASFGLPVNADYTGGRVKADVLIGEDGMARAIRFVR